mmetsp:Transcript_70100/g.182538  ORF Transcript_70100/g.182538 Transcript_70100/m.182538 type:complete len:223 (+) Transcript_70100:103-771(+)
MKLNDGIRLAGQCCVLVSYEAEMVATYHEWMQDPEILELTGSEPLTLEAEVEMQANWRQLETNLTFIILDVARPADPALGALGEGGAMAGDVNVFFNSDHDEETGVDESAGNAIAVSASASTGRRGPNYAVGEVEVMVADKASRRRGVAREALTLMMDYCHRELSTTTFVAKIKDHNAASIALFASLGLSFVKDVPVFGEVVYELRRHDSGAPVTERPVDGQ